MRAIYMWVVQHIALDCRATPRRPPNRSASYVLATRQADAAGFSALIAEMCRIAGIPCEIVEGVSKWDAADIGRVTGADNASAWNVVQLNGRWFVLDAARGAGHCAGKEFMKQLTDAWFLTNRKLFALGHYPRNNKSQLLDTPITRSAYVAAPIIGPGAAIIGLFPQPGQRGLLRGRQDSSVVLSLRLRREEQVVRTAVLVEGRTTEIPFSRSSDLLTVTIPFTRAGQYAVALLVDCARLSNAGPMITFRADVLPAIRRGR